MNSTDNRLRLGVIGAGSRGNAYARAAHQSGAAIVAAIAEPIDFKRKEFGRGYIWGDNATPQEGSEFRSWQDYLTYENERRKKQAAGEQVAPGLDAIFVCTLDHTHKEIVTSLAPLGIHVMCEKPLATSLVDCVSIYRAFTPPEGQQSKTVFAIGHVLRYSPHNILLRKLLLEDRAIGDILSIEHTEPVGYWHFAHSFVRYVSIFGIVAAVLVTANRALFRGNWRKESVAAPSLLTKSCHDIDLLLWLMCGATETGRKPHLPQSVTSSGSRSYFKRSRKPEAAKEATNCFDCPIENDCIYSAKKIYIDRHLEQRENTGWPLKIVLPEIEDCWRTYGKEAAKEKVTAALREDYDSKATDEEINARSWYGRCVYETSNDVCDNQVVTMTWDEELVEDANGKKQLEFGFGAKSATIHMVAFTEAICERRGWVYGTTGEMSYDSQTIRVHDFRSGKTIEHHPQQMGGGHGGGDDGLTMQFIKAVHAVKNEGKSADEAQVAHIGCTLEEVIRSHVMVFAADQARREKRVVDWGRWWEGNVVEKKASKQQQTAMIGWDEML